MQNDIDETFINHFTHQQQSDIVRLCVLYDYGGIWIDITSVITENLSWVVEKFNKGYDQVGFYINYPFTNCSEKTKYLRESWFIAVKNPHNYIILQWKQAFLRILNESIQNNGIINSKTWKETNKKSIPFFMRTYLSIHVANLWCIQYDKKYRKMYNKTVYLYNANTTALPGPTSKSTLLSALSKGYGYNSNFHLIKFTSLDRKILHCLTNVTLFNSFLNNEFKIVLQKYLDYK